jgi:hypothetical protein
MEHLEIIGLNNHHTYNKYEEHNEKIYKVRKLTLLGGQTNNLP